MMEFETLLEARIPLSEKGDEAISDKPSEIHLLEGTLALGHTRKFTNNTTAGQSRILRAVYSKAKTRMIKECKINYNIIEEKHNLEFHKSGVYHLHFATQVTLLDGCIDIFIQDWAKCFILTASDMFKTQRIYGIYYDSWCRYKCPLITIQRSDDEKRHEYWNKYITKGE